jgi:hypothetical protein
MDYCEIGDNRILDILNSAKDALGDYSLKFCVTQTMSRVIAYYPEKAKDISAVYGLDSVMPAIRISNSQTGQSALRVEVLWAREEGGSLFHVLEEVARDHRGARMRGFSDTLAEKWLGKVKDVLFDVYTKLPERLCELMELNFIDGTEGEDEARTIMGDVLNNVFAATGLEHRLLLCDTVAKKIKEQFLDEIDFSTPYSAYEFVESLMSLPERVDGITDAKLELMRKALKKVVYYPFETLINEIKAEVILTA